MEANYISWEIDLAVAVSLRVLPEVTEKDTDELRVSWNATGGLASIEGDVPHLGTHSGVLKHIK